MKHILLILLLLPGVASAEGIVNVTSTARDAFTNDLEIGGIYNRTLNVLQVWDGTGWKTVLISGGGLGTPLSGTLSNCSGLPISTGISGMASGAATFLATPSRTNANSLLSDADFLTTGAAEISGLTEKTTPHDDDWLLIEDSEASNAKKKLKVSNLPSGGGGGSGDIESVTAGDGLTGGGTTGAVTLNVGPGLALDVQADQIDFDPTELNGSRTWGDGSTDTIVWTFDRATGTDPTITFNSGSIGFQAITLGSALPVSSGGTGLTSLSANTVTFLGAADYAAMRTQLGLVIGTNVQAFDSDLSTYAGITPSSNVQSLLGAADYSAMRTLLSLVVGTNVQAYDADLTTWAGVTPGTGVATALAVNVGSSGAFVTNGGALGTPSSGTLTSCTGLPVSTGISGLGTGIATALAVNTGSAGAPVLFNGAGGTPSSITLTNGSGLPISTGVSGLGTGVATALAANANASTGFVTGNGTATLESKRITKRVVSVSYNANPTINTDNGDVFNISLTGNVTSFTTNLSGTPTDDQIMVWNVSSDSSGPYTISDYGASFQASGGVSLVTTMPASKIVKLLWIYSAAKSKWVLYASDPNGI